MSVNTKLLKQYPEPSEPKPLEGFRVSDDWKKVAAPGRWVWFWFEDKWQLGQLQTRLPGGVWRVAMGKSNKLGWRPLVGQNTFGGYAE